MDEENAVATVPFITKVVPPRVPARLLHRRRLLDLLHRCIDRRCTVLQAGPGYGKTTLLADFAAEADLPVCWYTLDEFDRDGAGFLTYLLAAVRQRFPTVGRRTALALAQTARTSEDLRRILGLLVTDLYQEIAEYYVLILDDLHTVRDCPEVVELLDLLLARQPANCHLVLAGRTLPRLRRLPALVAGQEALLLTSQDLAFTRAETEAFLVEVLQQSDVRPHIDRLHAWSGGWPIALLLANRTGSPADSPLLFDYLAGEVLEQLAAEVQAFLLATSILPELTAAACDALLERTDSGEQLRRLADPGGLGLPLQTTDRGYRYHPLFREFLQRRLQATAPDWARALHRRAAALAQHAGQADQALHHLIAAGEIQPAAALLEQVGPEWLRTGRWRQFVTCLEQLPPAERQRPGLQLVYAAVLLRLGQPERAGQLVQCLLDQPEAEPALRLRALAVASAAARLSGQYEVARTLAERAVAALDPALPASVQAEIYKAHGLALARLGRLVEAVPPLERALQLFVDLGETAEAASLHDALAAAAIQQGQIATARGHLERARAIWQTLGNVAELAQTLNNLGMVYYYQGELEAAREAFTMARDQARAAGYQRVAACADLSLGDVLRDLGGLELAMAAYQQGLETARQADEAALVGYALCALAHVFRLKGDLDRAETLARQALAQAQTTGSLFEQGLAEMALGATLLAARRPGPAVAVLSAAVEHLRTYGALPELSQALLFLAQASQLRGKGEGRAARQALREVADLLDRLGICGHLLALVVQNPLLLKRAQAVAPQSRGLRELAERAKTFRALTAPPAIIRPGPARWPRIEAFTLGYARVLRDGVEVTESQWKRSKSKELFFYLLWHRQWQSEEAIITALWPDVDPERVHSRFHSSLYQLRRALYDDCLIRDGSFYRLNPEGEFWCDAVEFLRLCEGARTDRESTYERALALYQGPFLRDYYAEWCEEPRRVLEQHYLRALTHVARYYLDHQQIDRCIDLLQRALAVDEFQDEVHFLLLQAYLAGGQAAAALAHYRRYQQRRREERLPPPPLHLQRLYQQIVASGLDSARRA